MPTQVVDLMFGVYRRKLLALLLLRPGEGFHVRELSRMAGISAGSIHRELKIMFEAGLLLRKKIGNQVHYEANRACPIFEELASIFRKTEGLANVLAESLTGLADRIHYAFVFGSMAAGGQTPESDVDVLVLGDVNLANVVKVLSPLQPQLGREINPVVISTEKFFSMVKMKDRFAMRVLDEPKIFAMGSENDFKKLVANREAR
jgi:predicted nucleotidyltransferase